jgi:hypothetical protein
MPSSWHPIVAGQTTTALARDQSRRKKGQRRCPGVSFSRRTTSRAKGCRWCRLASEALTLVAYVAFISCVPFISCVSCVPFFSSRGVSVECNATNRSLLGCAGGRATRGRWDCRWRSPSTFAAELFRGESPGTGSFSTRGERSTFGNSRAFSRPSGIVSRGSAAPARPQARPSACARSRPHGRNIPSPRRTPDLD